MKTPYLVISLDFELLWGVFDKVDLSKKKQYFLNTRRVIPQILKLFSEYDINATWATVGMLFNKNWEEWEQNIPIIIPAYSNQDLSPYMFVEKNKHKIDERTVFASDLIDLINATPNQEIGTHTYSHYYCLENGQNIQSFKSDLQQAILLAKKKDIEVRSLVFPRNQFNIEYLKICKEYGIRGVRTNPDSWYWKNPDNSDLMSKVFRTGDAYVGLMNKSYNLNDIKTAGSILSQQKASRFLRPYSGSFLNKRKLSRIKSELKNAAKYGEIYHLWWHPHNFGDSPENSISNLREILEYFIQCREKYSMESANMMGISRLKSYTSTQL